MLFIQWNRQGKTIVMVTHEANIAAYARKRLHMIDGNIDRIEEGSHHAKPSSASLRDVVPRVDPTIALRRE